MIKVMQYGEGNFLRTFADYYFDNLNEEGKEYSVNIVKPIKMYGNLENFRKQKNIYNIVLRGCENGKEVEKVRKITCVKNAIDPFYEEDKYYALATDKELKIIVSNTTEAGICFSANDDINGFENITYPAKLTKFLYRRFLAGLDGLYMMPVELIDNNADELYKCVDKYISLWNLPKEFKVWNDTKNYYSNTLVDRIVSGYPKTESDVKHIEELIGYSDKLVSIGEPFGLWAVEKKGDIEKYIPQGFHGINVVITDNIAYYKKRKVRVLNGSHTNLVPAGLWLGKETVYDCLKDDKMKEFILTTLDKEITPFVSNDIKATKEFADSIIERFSNPYLNHQLTSIALNSISKWKARNLPSFKDYYKENNAIPENMVKGFSYLMKIYSSVYEKDSKYYVNLPTRTVEICDDKKYLEYFASGKGIKEFMQDKTVWGEDLTLYNGFYEKVMQNIESINKGINIL